MVKDSPSAKFILEGKNGSEFNKKGRLRLNKVKPISDLDHEINDLSNQLEVNINQNQ